MRTRPDVSQVKNTSDKLRKSTGRCFASLFGKVVRSLQVNLHMNPNSLFLPNTRKFSLFQAFVDMALDPPQPDTDQVALQPCGPRWPPSGRQEATTQRAAVWCFVKENSQELVGRDMTTGVHGFLVPRSELNSDFTVFLEEIWLTQTTHFRFR